MTVLDGYKLYGFFSAGSRRVGESRAYLDDINVFPVPDGDTGTNLSSTMAGAVAGAVPEASASSTLGALADAALISARGNSGVIFAQFVSGLSEGAASAEMKTHDFARAVRRAYERAKAAITDPRDGTMLSVIEEWARSLARGAHDVPNFVDLIGATRGDLRRSLASTTERLAELRAAGLDRLHLGLESGSDEVLRLMHKGTSQKNQIAAGLKVKEAGMELSEYWMPGLGGQQLSETHARQTAAALNL
ncbi:MAG: DAK2 domain-containing protein, partial [Spirochaetes bacterium]|nr:DAK2 domain-containing protein [Spirochaetota bacterium]